VSDSTRFFDKGCDVLDLTLYVKCSASSSANGAFSEPSSSPPPIKITAGPLPSRWYAIEVPSAEITRAIGAFPLIPTS
jgi:hypothetical protein